MAALYLRGFKIDSVLNLPDKITIQEVDFFAIEISGIDTKLRAYAQANYVLEKNGLWSAIESVYFDENSAKQAAGEKIVVKYSVAKREFTADKKAATGIRSIFNQIKTVLEMLDAGRADFAAGVKTAREIIILANNYYKTLKEQTGELQNINKELSDADICNVIYAANQCILALNELVFSATAEEEFLIAVNTVLTKIIFSLYNF